ncbi:hypothetical protein D3C71_309010 [compost metagenome]
MLSPEEFTVGNVEEAPVGSIVLPRGKYESVVLLCEGDEEATAVFLSPQEGFPCFPAAGTDRWGGMIVPDVRLEVDQKSLYNPDSYGVLPGVLVREGAKLTIRAAGPNRFGRATSVTVKSGLPEANGGVAFTRWQVVIGRGDDKVVLHKVDLGDPPKD